MSDHIVSYFNSVTSQQKSGDFPIETILGEIRNDRFAKQINIIRETPNKVSRDKLKKKLPAITTSCITSGSHKASDVIRHSGLIQVDIDDIHPNQAIELKKALIKDNFMYACFFSPSNKIKGIIKIPPNVSKHHILAESIEAYFSNQFNVKIDKSCKDVSRLMYMSFDPELYHNPNSAVFDKEINLFTAQGQNTSQQLEAIQIIEKIENEKIDITGEYNSWIKIIYSLIEIFKHDARDYIHRISSFYPKYSYINTEKQIQSCINSNGEGITANTFFHYAKQYGIYCKKQRSEQEEAVLPITKVKRYIKSQYIIRLNEVSLDMEYKHIRQHKTFRTLSEHTLFIELLEKGFKISFNTLLALLKSDFVPQFDPFKEYFENLEAWDGIDYIEKLSNYVNAKNQSAFNHHFKKWIIRVVSCALNENFFNKQAFILVGSNQNSGKSTWCRFICPPALNKYIAENISTDKDSRILLVKNLLINLDEIALMNKSDLKSLKSYFSKTQINERLPWGKTNSIINRRCSFIGSTDEAEFLSDEAGSVRWLCFEIDSIDWKYSNEVDINKVYAQAYYLYKSGSFNYNLTRDEIKENEKRNKEFQVLTLERELIQKYLSSGELELGFQTSTEVMQQINRITKNEFSISHIQIGKALKMMGFKRIKKGGIYGYSIE